MTAEELQKVIDALKAHVWAEIKAVAKKLGVSTTVLVAGAVAAVVVMKFVL